MRHALFILTASLFVLAGRAQKTVIHDANAQVRAVAGFHGIEVSSAINLYLSKGEQEAVVVSAPNVKLRDRIRTEVVNGILKISLDKSHWSLGSNKLKAYVSFIFLDQLVASGASDILVDGVIAGDALNIDLSGASDFKGAVNVKELQLSQSGASDAKITGVVAGTATFRSSGASNIKGYDLVTEMCSIHASGASDIRITVNKELNAEASGASSIYYKGEGIVREYHTSGASSVKKAG